MEKKIYLSLIVSILLVLTFCTINVSAADILGDYNETTLTIISPAEGATYTSPAITFTLQKYIDYNIIGSQNYTDPAQYCVLDYWNNDLRYFNEMSYSNDTASLGQFTYSSNYVNGIKTMNIYCYKDIINQNNLTENLTYNKSLSFNVDYTSIKNCSDLSLINYDLTANYELKNNINCSGQAIGQIGVFEGSLDGRGYSITGYSGGPLISELYGQVQNLNMINVNISGGEKVGGLVGYAAVGSNMDKIKVTGTIIGTSHEGGIVGENTGTITNSESDAIITSTIRFAGGIAGENGLAGKIDNCISKSNINGVKYNGGITGHNYGIINNSFSYGIVSSAGDYAGGIVGQNGASGYTSAKIISSYALGNLSGPGAAVNLGGAIGRNYAAVVNNVYYEKNNYTVSNCIGTNVAMDKVSDSDCKALGQNNIASLNITANGKSINDPEFADYTGYLNFIIYDGWKPVVEFNYSIVNGSLAFNDTLITNGLTDKLSGYLIIRGLDATHIFGGTKTIYMDRMNMTMESVCVKDAEVDSKNDISPQCNLIDEYIVPCDGLDAHGYTCTLDDKTNQYIITGLRHSGVVQTDASETVIVVNNNGGSSSGGSSGCYGNWTCSVWGSCVNNNQTRICSNSKPTCTLGTKPISIQTCSNDADTNDNSILPLVTAAETDRQDNTSNGTDTGISPWALIGGGVLILAFIYLIFHMISNTEAKKLSLKKTPVTKKKN